jgi:hypothetical protein
MTLKPSVNEVPALLEVGQILLQSAGYFKGLSKVLL